MSAPPAFQFFARDFLADANVLAMTLEERGLYITLLALSWMEGSIPPETSEIARLIHYPERQAKKVWDRVSRCFVAREDGRLVNPRLEIERQKQDDYRRRQAERGSIGGSVRQANARADARQTLGLGLSANEAPLESGLSQNQALRTATAYCGNIPPIANAIVPPPERSQRFTPEVPESDFDADEPEVALVIANDAAENKTGTIAESKVRGLRYKLAKARDKHGLDAFRRGLQVAISEGMPAKYAIGVMRRYQPGEEDRRPSERGASHEAIDLVVLRNQVTRPGCGFHCTTYHGVGCPWPNPHENPRVAF